LGRTLRVNGGSVEMLADEVDYLFGVDTHRDQHTLAVAPAGAVQALTVVGASARGYGDALRSRNGTRAAFVSGQSRALATMALA
jgi:hypothetical protein